MSNNTFENPDNEPEIDPDMDFGEFEEKKSSSSIGDVWKSSPIVKLGLVAGALVAVVGAVTLFGGEEKKVEQSSVSKASDLKQTPGMEEVSPAMKQALEESNEQRIEEAVATGESVLPTPIEPPKTLLPVPTQDTQSEDPLVRWRQLQEERIRIQREQEQAAEKQKREVEDPQRKQSVESLSQSMLTQFSQLVGTKTIDPQNKMVVTQMDNLRPGAEGMMGMAGGGSMQTTLQERLAAQQQAQTIAPELLKVVVPAGEIEYAQLLVEANSDIPGPVVALIVSGPFSGARAMGSFTKKNDYLALQFTSVTGKDGNAIPIQAYAVDPETTLTGMATDVDHRYFERIILPTAAKFIEGVGSAVAQTATSTTTTGDTATQDTAEPDLEEELFKGVEEASRKAGEIFDEMGGDVETLVRVRAGTPMGILFTQPVTEQAIKKAQYVPVPGEEEQQPANPLQGLLMGGGNTTLLQNLQMQQMLQNQLLQQPAGAPPAGTPPQQ
jgi:intracellular multiplication protein IcmE